MKVNMEKIIIESRYGDPRIFTIIDDDTIEITGSWHYTRAANMEDTNELLFIDFDGGPFIGLGEKLRLKNYIFEVYKIISNKEKIVLSVMKL